MQITLTTEEIETVLSIAPNAELNYNAVIYERLLLNGIVLNTTKDSVISFDNIFGTVVKFISCCSTTCIHSDSSTLKCHHIVLFKCMATAPTQLSYIHTVLQET